VQSDTLARAELEAGNGVDVVREITDRPARQCPSGRAGVLIVTYSRFS
jgi:hypothetical protein